MFQLWNVFDNTFSNIVVIVVAATFGNAHLFSLIIFVIAQGRNLVVTDHTATLGEYGGGGGGGAGSGSCKRSVFGKPTPKPLKAALLLTTEKTTSFKPNFLPILASELIDL
uniref:Uncharacterized protein n=1 Tax=Romanomermis culicivorax TaxID=13658 RepID=A0A915HYQ1_ROMCU